jgi:hypothetical protein
LPKHTQDSGYRPVPYLDTHYRIEHRVASDRTTDQWFAIRSLGARKSTDDEASLSISGFDQRPAAVDRWKMRSFIMRYACLVYFDPKVVFNQSAESEAVLGDGFAYLEELRERGVLVTDGALQLPDQTMTLRVRDGKMSATDGPYLETKEMLAGFLVIEARDLNEALRVAAGIPLAKLGTVEVRPFVDFSKPRPTL